MVNFEGAGEVGWSRWREARGSEKARQAWMADRPGIVGGLDWCATGGAL